MVAPRRTGSAGSRSVNNYYRQRDPEIDGKMSNACKNMKNTGLETWLRGNHEPCVFIVFENPGPRKKKQKQY